MMQAQAQGQAPLLTVRDVSVVFGGIVALSTGRESIPTDWLKAREAIEV